MSSVFHQIVACPDGGGWVTCENPFLFVNLPLIFLSLLLPPLGLPPWDLERRPRNSFLRLGCQFPRQGFRHGKGGWPAKLPAVQKLSCRRRILFSNFLDSRCPRPARARIQRSRAGLDRRRLASLPGSTRSSAGSASSFEEARRRNFSPSRPPGCQNFDFRAFSTTIMKAQVK